MNGFLNISPKMSAAVLAGSFVTVGSCVAQANGFHLDAGVASAATVILAAIVGYFAPAHTTTPPSQAAVEEATATVMAAIAAALAKKGIPSS